MSAEVDGDEPLKPAPDKPGQDRPPKTTLTVGRPPDDATHDEILAWAMEFVKRVVGPATEP